MDFNLIHLIDVSAFAHYSLIVYVEFSVSFNSKMSGAIASRNLSKHKFALLFLLIIYLYLYIYIYVIQLFEIISNNWSGAKIIVVDYNFHDLIIIGLKNIFNLILQQEIISLIVLASFFSLFCL